MSKITVIQTNKTKIDFQSRIFQLEMSWEEFKYKVIYNEEIMAFGTMYGKVSVGSTIQVNINDDFHFEIIKEFGDGRRTISEYYLIEENVFSRFLENI